MSEHAHTPSLRIYFAVFALLLVLTGVTIGSAFIDLGGAADRIVHGSSAGGGSVGFLAGLNTIVALAIAGTKAVFVALFFMHLRDSPRLIWIVAVGGFLWLALLIGLTLTDVMTRAWI